MFAACYKKNGTAAMLGGRLIFSLAYSIIRLTVPTLGQIPSPFWKPGAPRPTSSRLQMILELMQTGSFLFTVSLPVRLSSLSSCSEKAVLSLYLTGSPGWVLISRTSHRQWLLPLLWLHNPRKLLVTLSSFCKTLITSIQSQAQGWKKRLSFFP